MLAIAGLGAIVGVVGTFLGWQLARDLDRGTADSLELTAGVLATVDESFLVAGDSLTILIDGVRDAEAATRALGRAMDEGEAALLAATELTGGEIADALESVEASLPGIESAAAVIDTTLGALSALPFGPDHDRDSPLAPSIAELRRDLDGLPEALRLQAAQVERTTRELTTATDATMATADRLGELAERLSEAGELIGRFGDDTGEVQELISRQQAALAVSGVRMRLLVLLGGLTFVLTQFVPLYLGLRLLGRGIAGASPEVHSPAP